MGILPFSNEEYSQRLEKIKTRMVQEGLDALILTRAQNIYLVAGYRAAAMNWTLPILPLIITQNGEMRLMSRVI